jgi:hypothetical protein
MAKFWISGSKKFGVIGQYAGRNACCDELVQKARARLSRRKERDGRAKNRESKHGAISRISFEGRSLPLAAAWSGYGCKPAARLTRSASLLMDPKRTKLDFENGSRSTVSENRLS